MSVPALTGIFAGAHLDAAQYTALWRHLGLGEKRLILDTLDHGTTLPERDALDARALAGLGPGVDPALADALAVIRAPDTEIDVRMGAGGPLRGVLACARGGLAVVAGLDEASGLRLAPAPPDDLAGALLAHVPDVAAMPGVPMDVPADAFLGRDTDTDADADPGGGAREQRLRRAGVPRPTLERLSAMLAAPPRRVLQFGVARRDVSGRRHRGTPVLTVLDTAAGRVALRRDGPRIVLRPTDRSRLRPELAAMLAAVPATV